MNKLIIFCFVIFTMSCTKLYEHTENEYIPRPEFDVEIPLDPEWDTIPQIENELKGTPKN